MRRRKATNEVLDLDQEGIPEWKRQSMARSLQSARARADARCDRFVAVATQLMNEKGDTDFTVQDVVDRSRMSIRTFYRFFESKDKLLIAVHESVVAREVVPRLRRECDKETDPLLRLRAYIEALLALTAKPGRVARALTSYQNRLAETRPANLAKGLKPQFDLLVELIDDISRAGRLRDDLNVQAVARLVHYTVFTAVHERVLGSDGALDVTAETIWRFCATGITVRDSGATRSDRPTRAPKA